jgi:serine/threonine-protein kinase
MAKPPNDMKRKAEALVGTTFCGKWTLDRLIDIGGMGAVYAAKHRNGKRVAVKLLHPMLVSDPETRERFLREGYVANRVDHPGVVSVLDDDVAEDGSVFLVMELLEGESLERLLAQAGNLLPADKLLPLMDPVIDVLAAAHEHGIVHRDIKPANLFVTREGQVKVLDFGLAHVRERVFNERLTRTGIVMGTSSYMPPEQARARWDLVDARSDIWALGATIFRGLTGLFVHAGNTPTDRMIAAMKQHAPTLASVLPDVHPAIARLVDKALAFQKEDRWPDARTMQYVLRAACREAGIELTLPHMTLPSTPPPPREGPASDVINVVVDTSASPGSLIVEFSEGPGQASRYQLQSKTTASLPEIGDVATLPAIPAKKGL